MCLCSTGVHGSSLLTIYSYNAFFTLWTTMSWYGYVRTSMWCSGLLRESGNYDATKNLASKIFKKPKHSIPTWQHFTWVTSPKIKPTDKKRFHNTQYKSNTKIYSMPTALNLQVQNASQKIVLFILLFPYSRNFRFSNTRGQKIIIENPKSQIKWTSK